VQLTSNQMLGMGCVFIRCRFAHLGFKNPNWITAIEVTNTFIPTYWSERGLTGSAELMDRCRVGKIAYCARKR
jgi:hypothetical protein